MHAPSPVTFHDPYAPGQLLGGKYLVERQLGEGGMGRVLLAMHTELDRRVAVKLLRADLASEPLAVDRFLREARAAARIDSEHVVHVFDVDRFEDGCPYIVMEYLEGEDLGRCTARGAIPVEEAVDYVLQACVGIAEAHRVGVVHRDLKPENLFLSRRRDGTPIVKVVDFGISKLAPKMGRREAALTLGNVIGTPFYMSPEQLRGDASADARSDVWSLGVILFELVTAEAPFVAETLPALCTQIMQGPARTLAQARPDLCFPEGLEQVIEVCMAKDPQSRYSGAVDLAIVLSPFAPSAAQALHAASNLPTKPPVPVAPDDSEVSLVMAQPLRPPKARAVAAARASTFVVRRTPKVALAVVAGTALATLVGVVAFIVAVSSPASTPELAVATAFEAPTLSVAPSAPALALASNDTVPVVAPSATPPPPPASRPPAAPPRVAKPSKPRDEFGGRL
jgi:serine/threonine protein kinase